MTKEEIKAVIEILQEKYLLEIEALILENKRLKEENERLKKESDNAIQLSHDLLFNKNKESSIKPNEFYDILEGDVIKETDFIVKLVDESMIGKPFKYGTYPPILRRIQDNHVQKPKFQLGDRVYKHKERHHLDKMQPYFVVHVNENEIYIDLGNYYAETSIKCNPNDLEFYGTPTRKL